MNKFDGAVVVMSVAEVVVQAFDVEIGVNTSVLRACRLLRVFRLARSWRGLQAVLSCLLNSVSDLSNLFLLLALGIFIFALLGMQLFGAQFTPATGYPEVPRTNYDCIGTAMLTVFVVMSGENWNDVWADTKHAVGAGSAAFYVLLVVAGNFVTLNLFVAILLNAFADDSDDTASMASSSRLG